MLSFRIILLFISRWSLTAGSVYSACANSTFETASSLYYNSDNVVKSMLKNLL